MKRRDSENSDAIAVLSDQLSSVIDEMAKIKRPDTLFFLTGFRNPDIIYSKTINLFF